MRVRAPWQSAEQTLDMRDAGALGLAQERGQYGYQEDAHGQEVRNAGETERSQAEAREAQSGT
jgi:hypothetical protein